MIKKTLKIQFDTGADVRPIAMLVQIANQYSSQISLQDSKHKFNAKSIMGMMTLCGSGCREIELVAEGADAEKAVEHIEKFLSEVN